MRSVQYDTTIIEYSSEVREEFQSHYTCVAKESGVVLKGPKIPQEKGDKLILRKAGWIVRKLHLVRRSENLPIVTSSRLQYLGRSYYVHVSINSKLKKVGVEFNYSSFKIYKPSTNTTQREILEALNLFYKVRCLDKIAPRAQKLATRTGLSCTSLSFRNMSKRWGSCTPDNKIILNIQAVTLPLSLIDYIILHGLCHTQVKDYSKKFWKLVAKYVENWKELDGRMKDLDL